ncbi:Choline dehydrogenase [Lasiodiplodia theobromae]|uniref:Choline dehydrogenase n=1 Tax=Lasiodiplodia theobromae TaxID=45133 RepID=UPI0015C3543E|nr:Choline dehydrogenase [Lasiodiplodia theobromae]KAF4539453.1 Choline dehydrogenase [Lasiodiplodia theobromae]
MAFGKRCLIYGILAGSFSLQPACALPILDSLVNPYLDTLKSILSGKGLIEGTLGAVQGALGVEKTFDYVVVGGGTGGNAIGVRLAEAGFSVAIIEAGLYYEIGKPVLGSTPAGGIVGIGANPLDSDPLVDWVFMTEPQAGANNREVHYARGKCLGGSSALNFMIYHRGSEQCYQQWADAVGDDSYTYQNLDPYFKKAVTFTEPNNEKRGDNVTSEYETDAFATPGGPVQVGYTNYVSPFATWMEKALLAVGLKKTSGFSSGKLLGTHYTQTTIRSSDQTRSASDAYVKSALDNPNLSVYTNTMAQKILFDDNKTATGVTVQSTAITYDIHASKEVIVAAGSFQSPQLLMVSGIGPKETLEQHGIDVIADRPGVGQNMWDHIMFGPAYEVSFNTLDYTLHNPVALADALADYATTADGILSSNVVEFLGWEKLPQEFRQNFSQSTVDALSQFADDWPEVELISGNGYIGDFSLPVLQQPLDGKQYATILGGMVAPTSRGNVTIKSASMNDAPVINPNWLTTKADQEMAVALFRRMRQIWASETMQEVVVGDEYWPGLDKGSDEEILEVVRDSLMTIWHAACTCKMGKEDDEMAVVDTEAKVYGVSGLRIVDASAMPILPPGHPSSTIYALAEKIADGIVKS